LIGDSQNAEAFARPMRIAYLVDVENSPAELFDAIFAECYGRWGGRWTLIVPCENNMPKPDYKKWLMEWDPDLIYSYVTLPLISLAELHECIYPSLIVIHKFYGEGSAHEWRPNLNCEPVHSLSVIPLITSVFRNSPRDSLRVFDVAWGSMVPAQWVRDSFGLPRYSIMSGALIEAGASMVPNYSLIAKSELEPPHLERSPNKQYETDERSWLLGLAKNRLTFTLSDLSSLHSQRLDLGKFERKNELTVVVGSTNSDRLLFWNSFHSKSPNQLGVYTLRIEQSAFEDDSEFDLLATIIECRNQNWSGGMHQTVLKSCSIDDATLKAFAKKLQDKMRNPVRHEFTESPEVCIPKFDQFYSGSANHVWTHRFEKPASVVAYFGNTVRCTKPSPIQFEDASRLPAIFRSGAWMLDIKVDRQKNHSQYFNQVHRWSLPRRLRFARRFITNGSVSTDQQTNWLLPRASKLGLLSVATSMKQEPPSLTIPSDETLLSYALRQPHDWQNSRLNKSDQEASTLWSGYEDCSFSDKGRYLVGTINLFGSFNHCLEILSDQKWLKLFGALGSNKSHPREAAIERIVNKIIKKRLWNQFPLQIKDSEELKDMLETSWIEVRNADLAEASLEFNWLKERWEEEFNSEIAPTLHHFSDVEQQDIKKSEYESFIDTIQDLAEKNILHQGHEWQCNQCLHRNWKGIEQLSKTWSCEVCSHSRPADIEAAWRFRLNGFLKRALSDHGLEAVIWCLKYLRDKAEHSFYFMPSVNLFETRQPINQSRPTNEADLLAVVDGKTYLCEIKSSDRGIPAEIRKFADIASKIRPDVALIAILHCSDKNRIKFKSDLEKLLPMGVSAEVISRTPPPPTAPPP
jgi:hypothetical protein